MNRTCERCGSVIDPELINIHIERVSSTTNDIINTYHKILCRICYLESIVIKIGGEQENMFNRLKDATIAVIKNEIGFKNL